MHPQSQTIAGTGEDSRPLVTVISPVHNELENLPELVQRIRAVMESRYGDHWEYILVDDGSTDGSSGLLDEMAAADSRLRAIHHPRNQGERAAWKTGFAAARGDVAGMLAADLQSQPEDLPALFDVVLKDGYDVGTGWRRCRRDARFYSLTTAVLTLYSRIVFDVRVLDVSSSFFAVRGNLIRDLDLVENDHRYILAVFRRRGAHIKEIPIDHRPRTKGASHYRWTKVFGAAGEIIRFTQRWSKGFYDLPSASAAEPS